MSTPESEQALLLDNNADDNHIDNQHQDASISQATSSGLSITLTPYRLLTLIFTIGFGLGKYITTDEGQSLLVHNQR